MLLLNNATSLLKVITAGSQAIDVTVDWMDDLAGAITPGTLNTAISSATTQTVCVSPAGSTSRNIKTITIRNTDAAASDLITVERYDGTTTSTMWQFTLPAGYSWTMMDFAPIVTDSNGGQYVTPLAGRFIKTTLLISASANFTTGPQTNTIKIRGVGAGGAGGGGTSVASAANGCGGGGAGSYLEVTVTVTPNTAYAYTCGVGGTGVSASAGNGGTGTTTFVVGATTYTCNQGGGATAVTSAATTIGPGGAGGAVSTNGTLNATGNPGLNGAVHSATLFESGGGGSSPFGGGGAPAKVAGTGAAGGGFGSGGAGGASGASAASTGGAGANGCWVVDEYS